MELNLHFPPSLANSTNTTETQDVLRARPHNPPLDPSGAMVPGNSPQSQEMETPTLLRDSKYWVTKLRELDRLQFLKLALAQEHGDRIADTLISAHRPSTNRQAQSVWKKFQAWLPADSEEITHNTVLQFLIFLHSTLNLNARTIINCRGCLALPLKTAFKIDFDHESFGLLTRSIFIKEPSSTQKDPQLVSGGSTRNLLISSLRLTSYFKQGPLAENSLPGSLSFREQGIRIGRYQTYGYDLKSCPNPSIWDLGSKGWCIC